MHLNRSEIPRIWPVARKGTKYVVRPSHNKNYLPLLVILRDIMKLVKNEREMRQLVKLNKIKVNGKIIKEKNFALGLFDVLSLENKNFKIIIKNKKYSMEETKNIEKTAKVIGKKMLKKGKIQINLNDGRNYLFNEKINVGDSVVINLQENKISKVLGFKKSSKIIFTSGKHIGEQGIIEELGEKGKIIVKVDKEKINAEKENIMVID